MAVTQIVTVPNMKAFLNITSATFDSQVSSYIDAASQMIVNRIGPVAGSPTYDETYDGGSSQIVLRHTPVQSVTSVTESYGATAVYTLTAQVLDVAAVGTYGYSVDLAHGLLVRRVSGIATQFARGLRNIHVVYVAGYAATPADIQHATMLLIQHMWATQRGGSRRPGQGNEDIYGPGTSFTWPRRVEEILATYYVPGIA